MVNRSIEFWGRTWIVADEGALGRMKYVYLPLLVVGNAVAFAILISL